MATPRVLLVYKRSAYLRLRLGGAPQGWMGQREFKDYVQVLKTSHWNHYGALATVRNDLRERGLEVVKVLREELTRVEKADGQYGLVVAVGGDGTFMDAAHWTGRVPILGVNSDPSRSVGRFSSCLADDFAGVLDQWAAGRLKPVRVPRLSVSVNGNALPWPVLNEALFAAKSPAATSRYLLKAGKRTEEQISSGVWVATAAGSSAAILSAGGRLLPFQKETAQYLVREPFEKKFGKRRLVRGMIPKGKSLEFVSHMRDGMLFLDGCSLTAPVGMGDKVKLSLSAPPLSVIGMKPYRPGRVVR